MTPTALCPADMPRVTGQHIDKLIAAFDPVENRAICVPTYHGKRGNPVLWGRAFFDAIGQVSGDTGARHLIGEHGDQTVEVEVDDDGVLYDIDTPEMLAAANQPTDAREPRLYQQEILALAKRGSTPERLDASTPRFAWTTRCAATG